MVSDSSQICRPAATPSKARPSRSSSGPVGARPLRGLIGVPRQGVAPDLLASALETLPVVAELTGADGRSPFVRVDFTAVGPAEREEAVSTAASVAALCLGREQGGPLRVLWLDLGEEAPGRCLMLADAGLCSVGRWRALLEELGREVRRLDEPGGAARASGQGRRPVPEAYAEPCAAADGLWQVHGATLAETLLAGAALYE